MTPAEFILKFWPIIGTLVVWGGIALARASRWQRLEFKVGEMEKQLVRQDAANEKTTAWQTALTASLNQMTRQEERLENYHKRLGKLEETWLQFTIVQNDVQWIRKALEDRQRQLEKGQ